MYDNGGNREPETFDAEGLPINPTPMPKIDLRDPHAIRRELGSVYRDMRAGRILTQDGTRLAYVLDRMLKAYETAALLERDDLLNKSMSPRKMTDEELDAELKKYGIDPALRYV